MVGKQQDEWTDEQRASAADRFIWRPGDIEIIPPHKFEGDDEQGELSGTSENAENEGNAHTYETDI
jgi:hypothetical protein